MSKGQAKEDEARLVEAEGWCRRLAEGLPSEIDIHSLGVWSKAPYKALVIRGGLIWRTEELGRTACQAFRDGNRATGIILVRSAIENAAVLWRLKKTLESRAATATAELHDILDKMLLGWKSDPEFPNAYNVLTLIDHLDREIAGVRHVYDQLSEVAHPNYGGVHGLYAKNDQELLVTRFGRDLRSHQAAAGAIHVLPATLGVFFLAYNAIGKAVGDWLPELSPLSGPRDDDEVPQG